MIKKISILLLTMFCIQACSSALVIPKSNNSFEVRGQGMTSHNALKSALKGAKNACKGNDYVIDSQNVLYKGAIDEQSKDTINQLSNIASSIAVLNSSTNNNIFIPYNPASTNEDYEAILQGKCL